MKKLLLLSILVATVAIPMIAATDRSAIRGLQPVLSDCDHLRVATSSFLTVVLREIADASSHPIKSP
jgi:hypothetical protein